MEEHEKKQVRDEFRAVVNIELSDEDYAHMQKVIGTCIATARSVRRAR